MKLENKCNGKGFIPGSGKCQRCEGSGEINSMMEVPKGAAVLTMKDGSLRIFPNGNDGPTGDYAKWTNSKKNFKDVSQILLAGDVREIVDEHFKCECGKEHD